MPAKALVLHGNGCTRSCHQKQNCMRYTLVALLSSVFWLSSIALAQPDSKQSPAGTTLLVYGGDIQPRFVELVAKLTGKPRPRICYLPTASADNERNIRYWEIICRELPVEPHVLKVWVTSGEGNPSFAAILNTMDAVVVGGGNTLNMLGIWRAQGIDTLLEQAYHKGVVLSGGSAGSLCWFQSGVSDSRPDHLSLIRGLGLLPFSHCPHYHEKSRRELFESLVLSGKAGNGYGCDEKAAILFRNGRFHAAYSTSDVHHSYAVRAEHGVIVTDTLQCSILVAAWAVPADSMKVMAVGKTLLELENLKTENTPLGAFVAIKRLLANGQVSKLASLSAQLNRTRLKQGEPDQPFDRSNYDAHMKTSVNSVLVYDDKIAAVVNNMYNDFFGVWYFYNEGGKWLSAGEDYGGETLFEAELSFREKVPTHLKNRVD